MCVCVCVCVCSYSKPYNQSTYNHCDKEYPADLQRGQGPMVVEGLRLGLGFGLCVCVFAIQSKYFQSL